MRISSTTSAISPKPYTIYVSKLLAIFAASAPTSPSRAMGSVASRLLSMCTKMFTQMLRVRTYKSAITKPAVSTTGKD